LDDQNPLVFWPVVAKSTDVRPLAAKNTLKISWTDGNYITIIAQTQREVHGHT